MISVQEILDYAKNQYGTEPDYPWKSDPTYAVLRTPGGKWYALLMEVPEQRLRLCGNERVFVMNLKCDPMLIGSLRMEAGFLPAYHMNKENWISVLLCEETVSPERVKELIDLSYDLTVRKTEKRKKNSTEEKENNR